MRLLDAHIHLDFYNEFSRIVSEVLAANMQVVFVTHLPELFAKYKPLFITSDSIKLALGYHPILVNEYPLKKDLFCSLCTETDFIGEVGLDYITANSIKTRELQRDAFSYICEKANNKIFSIHSRASEEDALKILADNGVKKAIFHWYTGNEKVLRSILESGYYFSVNPMMLRSSKGIAILRELPISRVLVETDGPFTKYRNKIVLPSNLEEIYSEFSDFYRINNLSQIVFDNFKNLTL